MSEYRYLHDSCFCLKTEEFCLRIYKLLPMYSSFFFTFGLSTHNSDVWIHADVDK